MSRVAVTGATGFVGHHLSHALHHGGHELVVISRPTSDIGRLPPVENHAIGLDDVAALARALTGCAAVFHLAGAVDFGSDWPRFEQANVVGTANIIAAARAAGVPRLVHCSSIVAVGATREPRRLDESARWNLEHLQVPYVTTKRRAEECALASNGRCLDVVVANPACVIGPDDFAGSEFGTLCQRFWKGRLPIHFGGGNSFVDVRDVAGGLIAAWQRGRAGERYLLSGANRSMTAFFGELGVACGEAVPRLRLPSGWGAGVAWLERQLSSGRRRRAYLSPGQARLLPWFFYFDHEKATRELGYSPRPLAQSLHDAFVFWRRRNAA